MVGNTIVFYTPSDSKESEMELCFNVESIRKARYDSNVGKVEIFVQRYGNIKQLIKRILMSLNIILIGQD